MTTKLQRAWPCAAPESKSCAMSQAQILIHQSRTQTERDLIQAYAGGMDELTRHFRSELRGIIWRYRLWRAAREIVEMQNFYLQAEGEVLEDHIRRVFRLYREANRDLQAMKRAGTGNQ